MAMNFNQYAAEGNEFLKDYAREMDLETDPEKAARIFTSVIHALRELITPEESVQLIALFPMFLKAIYVNGWTLKKLKPRIKKLSGFINLVQELDGVLRLGGAVVADQHAVEVVQLESGSRAEDGGDEALQGRVKTVEPVGFTKVSALGVEEQRVQVIVEIVTPRAQWARLGDGYRVEAAFLLWEADNVLQVPTSALFRVDQDWALFLAGDGRAVLQVVKPGQRSGISTQILAGIEAGQVLINHPGDNLEPGSPIRPR